MVLFFSLFNSSIVIPLAKIIVLLFSLTLIPALAVIMCSALLVTIFSTMMNTANADSLPFSSLSPSPVQSEPLQQQQQPLDTNGTMMTTNPNEQQIMHQPFPLSPPLSPLLQSQPQPSQQQQNQPTQQPLDTNGMSNSHNKNSNNNNKPDNYSPSTVSLLPF
jgi:hypothetical protein